MRQDARESPSVGFWRSVRARIGLLNGADVRRSGGVSGEPHGSSLKQI